MGGDVILTDEDIESISLSVVSVKDAKADARAVEAAVLAKLASKKPDAWAFKVNNFHRHVEFYCPPEDGYDEGTLMPLYSLKGLT